MKYKVGDQVMVTEVYFIKKKYPKAYYKDIVVDGYANGQIVKVVGSLLYLV